MVPLKYINKRSATIAAMKDYESMKTIIANTPEDIIETYATAVSLQSPQLNGVPNAFNPQAGEYMLVKGLDQVDVMQGKYCQAKEYMVWFESAWLSLTDKERIILREFYMQNSQRSGATKRLCDRFSYSESHIDRLRKKALNKFIILLYGI